MYREKSRGTLESVKPYIDAVMTFEELQALYDSKDIDITTLGEDVLDNASYFGRIKAKVDKYGREALEKTIGDAVAVLK